MNVRFIGSSFFLLCSSLFASDPLLLFGGGVFNVIKGSKYPQLQLEYRGNSHIYYRKYLWIRPTFGAFINSKASTYVFGGLAFDVFIGERFVFTPTFSPGVYFPGSGKRLGYPLEFRSSVELSYVFPKKSRLGLQFYHISNGTFGETNPGTECLLLFYGFRL